MAALILTDNIKMDRIPTKIKRKIHALFTLSFKFWKYFFFCKTQPLGLLFLVIFIYFYINRYNFSQIFKTSFSDIWKKDFCDKFFLSNKVTQTLYRLKQTKSANCDKNVLSMLPKEGDFVQHRKSVTHLFISYWRNSYIIIYIYNLLNS